MVRQVAIVEDRPDEAALLQSYFSKYSEDAEDSFHIVCFSRADTFINSYQPVYDMIFMDIMMPGMNGLDAAKKLREKDRNVVLVFVTNMAQFAVRGYEVEAFDFIVKPVTYRKFTIKMARILVRVRNEQRDTTIQLNLSKDKKWLAPSQIRYVEVVMHKLVFHTTEGEYSVYGSMKSAEEQLNPAVFSRCNRCYLVNLNYVTGIRGMSVIMGKEELQMSRSRKKPFVEQLNVFLGENM